ncbi:iron ABC transporter substrate-binding protein [Propionibacteriaceae bacterium G1746]|uniref:iron ABC transporter substrate-binding protein n=1 Tax=Aestuariimicrobium sp. G57 TaxID=3418485 RepID=UPI003C14D744
MHRRTFIALGAAALGLSACSKAADDSFQADPDALVIYSSQHENVTREWLDAFTAVTGKKTQVRQGSDAAMGHQIVAEGDKSPADVFLTENSPAMTLVQRAGLLAPVGQATLDQLPTTLVPSSKDWTPIAARSTVLIWNPSKIGEADLPASMMDLQDASWKGRWGGAPGGADFQAIVAGMLAMVGEQKTSAWLTALKANANIYQNNIATMKAVNAGEVPVGIMYHYYWYRDQAATKQGSQNTRLHYFKGEDPGAFVSLSGGGVLKSSKKPELAQQFLRYITSAPGQQVLTTSGSMEYAVGKSSASDPVLPPLTSLQAPKVDPTSLNSETVIKMMTDAGIL